MDHDSRHLRSLLRELREAFVTEVGDLATEGYADLATEIGAALGEMDDENTDETMTALASNLKLEAAQIERRLNALMGDAESLYDGTQTELSDRLGAIDARQQTLVERLVELTARLKPGQPVPGLSENDATRFWTAYEQYEGRREALALPTHRDACHHAAHEIVF